MPKEIGKTFVAAAVQMRVAPDMYYSQEVFKSRIEQLVKGAIEKSPGNEDMIIVFPEDVGAGLMFLGEEKTVTGSTTVMQAAQKMIASNIVSVAFKHYISKISWIRSLALLRSKVMAKVYVETFSNLAKENKVFIVAGSIPLAEYPISQNREYLHMSAQDNEVYNISYVFGPDGKILGYQKKVNLIDLEGEDGFDFTQGLVSNLRVIKSPFANIGITVCLDGFNDVALGILRKQKMDLLIQPSANPGPWSEEQQEDWLNGAWAAVNNKNFAKCAINPMLVGELFDIKFEGQSSIIGSNNEPVKAYKDLEEKPGFLAVASSFDKEEIITAKIQL